MVDYKLGVTIDVQAGCPNVDGYAEAADKRLIFGDVVGRGEMEADCVLELACLWEIKTTPAPALGPMTDPSK